MAKKSDYPYKKLKKEDFERLQKMSEEELYEEMFKAERNEAASKRQRKNDPDIQSLNEKINTFILEHMPDELLKELDKVKRDEKQTKKEIKEDKKIQDEVFELKEKRSEYSNLIKEFTETKKAILKILEDRRI